MALLSLEAVTRRHRAGRQTLTVLDQISLEVWPGDVVAIWGARRSGKTTLLRVAAGVETPDAGVVRFDGEELGRRSAAERARLLRRIGYAPKEWRVAHGKPVLDHVALPLLAEGRPLASAMAKAHEAMEQVGAGDCAAAATHELAPGDQMRVALARALVRNPRLLLVDEAGVTADSDERDEILRLLRSIVAERDELALVLTTRDVAGIGGAARVMSLGDGRLRTYDREPAQVVPLPLRPRVETEPAR
jgi:ABC-type methionine transport system ATPase subunit